MFQFKLKRKRKSPKQQPIRTKLPWSSYQKNVFANVGEGDGHTIVVSGPGSGKTKTLVESLYHIPNNLRILYTAFNRSAAKNLERQVPSYVQALTHHALSFRCVRRNWGPVYNIGSFGSVDTRNDSLFELATEQVGSDPALNQLRQMLVKALDLSKITITNSPEEIQTVVDKFGISLCGLHEEEFANHVWQMMEKTRNAPRTLNGRNVITFSDMVWLPFVHGWKLDQFDRVVIDEAQDLSPIRTELLLSSVAPGGRILAAGDHKQAINGFAGATTESLKHLSATLKAKELPLTVSYRCAKQIIEMAQAINPFIEAAPNAPDGKIDTFEGASLYDVVEPGCAVLSRANYPLVRACFGMLARGLNANIQGKDIGERLLWRIDCWKPDDTRALINAARNWSSEINERLIRKRIDTTSVTDEAKCIEVFAERSDNIDEVKKNIKNFFSDNDAQIKLSTVHKAKGSEYNKVFLLNKTFHPERGGEEENIHYVSITRARNYLGILEGKLP